MTAAYVNRIARMIASRHGNLREAIGVRGIALIVDEAFEDVEIVRRLADRIGLKSERVHAMFEVDPYADLNPKEREFCESLDVWTLEQVIIRVLTEIDRRRLKQQEKLARSRKERAEGQ